MTRHLFVAALLLSVGYVAPCAAFSNPKAIEWPSQKVEAVLKSADLSQEAKVTSLSAILAREDRWPYVLFRIGKLDQDLANDTALELFRQPASSWPHRIEAGRYLLEQEKPGFKLEFAAFLISAILNGGEKEFCVPRPENEPSVVGEYAGISGGINAPRGIGFDEVADQRVVPILIRCLDAPDHVYPAEQGELIRGTPGEPTGRNTQRQGIPLALAKLGAVSAIPNLDKILFSHPDFYLRYNAAYALAILMPRKDSLILEKRLLESREGVRLGSGKVPIQRFLFPFGKGLIEKGEDDGAKYMSFAYSEAAAEDSLLRVLYVTGERMNVLKGHKGPNVEAFYREALAFAPLRDLFLFDTGKVKNPETGLTGKDAGKLQNQPEKGLETNRKRIVEMYATILTELKANNIRTLDDPITEIGNKTKNDEIRRLSQEFLARASESK